LSADSTQKGHDSTKYESTAELASLNNQECLKEF
jgi:hypothetical protein